jgi:hypothetical protein
VSVVTDVGDVAEELQVVDEFRARFSAAFTPNPSTAPVPLGRYFFAFS